MFRTAAARIGLVLALIVVSQAAMAGNVEDGLKAARAGRYDEARRLWMTEPNSPVAQNNLGVLYERGYGVTKDEAQARDWYMKAAAAKDRSGMYNLGAMLERGAGGAAPNPAEAAKWYEASAALGDRNAMDSLAAMKETGRGVPADPAGAVALYRKSAQLGSPRAQNNLGAIYEKGLLAPRDETAAAGLYRMAAVQGYSPAQNNLGVLYGSGRGVARSYVEAAYWFSLAAERGDKSGIANRDKALPRLQPAEREQLTRRLAQPRSTAP